jgi:hypothetical protein
MPSKIGIPMKPQFENTVTNFSISLLSFSIFKYKMLLMKIIMKCINNEYTNVFSYSNSFL